MSERFLIARLSAIGDTIHALPLAAALRRLFPDSFIGWAVERPASPLVVNNPLVDWTHVLPRKWLKSPSEILRLRRALRKQGFTVAFDVQGLTKSGFAAWLSGAPLRIGFTKGEARELSGLFCTRRVEPGGTHVIDKVRSLLAGLGVSAPPVEFVFPECPSGERAAVDEAVSRPEAAGGFALFGPWGSFPGKRWPLSRYRELAARLKAGFGLSSLVLGHGPAERQAVERELGGREGGAMLMAPDVSLPGVVELARRARIFVGGDSFPMHAAAAVSTPTVALFAVTDPLRLGPYGEGHRVVRNRTRLEFPSRRERAGAGTEFIESIDVGMAESACAELLARRSPHDSGNRLRRTP